MVIDLKVLVRSFNEEAVRVMLETLAKVSFSSSRKNIFYSRKFRESWILWIIIVVYIAAS